MFSVVGVRREGESERERVLALLTVIFTELNVGEHVCAEAAPEAQGARSFFFFSPLFKDGDLTHN